MDLDVRGKAYALVGGTRGMGWACAQILSSEGAHVALIARDAEFAKARAEELTRKFGFRAEAFAADGSKEGELDAAMAAAIKSFGRLRGLLVSTGSTQRNGTVTTMSEGDWAANVQDVLMGTVRACKAVLPHFVESGGGHIVTSAAYSMRDPKENLHAYAALKAAVANFTKNLAKTYAANGVRANCVCPGAIETGRLGERITALAQERGVSQKEAGRLMITEVFHMPVAMGRPGEPGEVGDLMAFLLSERAAYMTGAVINVDGGTNF